MDGSTGDAGSARRADWIRRAALHYLERYASSEANLRRVLVRRLKRRRDADPERWTLDDGVAARLVDDAVAHCRALGLVDDAAYADTRAAVGRRKGLARARIIASMAAKGVSRAEAERAVAEAGTDDETAAVIFARRRRFGPFRTPGRRRDDEDRRELAAMVRQGFPLATARRVLAMDPETAEAMLAGGDPAAD